MEKLNCNKNLNFRNNRRRPGGSINPPKKTTPRPRLLLPVVFVKANGWMEQKNRTEQTNYISKSNSKS